MIKVADLACGWSLHADPDNANPYYLTPKGLRRMPAELAYHPDARILMRQTKQLLDVMDIEWKQPGNDVRFRATDRAKLALQVALIMSGRYDESLLEHDVSGRLIS
jgi:hypothetical protein